ncbi:MAG: Ig-like domain-containing protein [Neptuniibacter sp.]
MTFPFVRSINFVIPPHGNSPQVVVTATEVNGEVVFELEVEKSRPGQKEDLWGLFFDLNRPDIEIDYAGQDITGFEQDHSINFQNRNNLQGRSDGYDVGINFGSAGKGGIETTEFTLSSAAGLTLDDIANVEFAARVKGAKLTVEAPAAPDAVADIYNINEESAPDLASPSTVPTGTVFQVLENDTDADGDTLTIVDLYGPQHGTIEIVDGDDADDLIGDAILYTPDEDYSGTDEFYYLVDDGNGGTDFAKVDVNIEAVADIPDLSYEILKGELVNQIVVRVTTAHTDADGSEYIDRIELGGLPQSGVSVSEAVYNPTSEPEAITAKDFTLTLDKEADFDFDLFLTSVAKEESNGDEEVKTEVISVSYNEEDNHFDTIFVAEDQSMWNTGDAFQFTDDRFWGVDSTADFYASAGPAYVDVYGSYKFGLESSLYVDGGLVDAEASFSADIDTYYNHTTDWLRLETDAFNQISNSWFSTSSPNLNYSLDLVGDFDMDMTLGADLDLSKSVPDDWGPLGAVISWVTKTFSFHESTTLNADYNFDLDLFTFDGEKTYFGPDSTSGVFSDTAEWDLGDFFTLKVQAPHINTTSSVLDGDTLSATGTTGDVADKNFVSLSFDVDQALAALAGLPVNPLGDDVSLGVVTLGFDIVNYELIGVLDIGQNYFMDIDNLGGEIYFEDGSSQLFTFGDDLDFFDASDLDANNNGFVEYDVLLSPEAQFYSDLFLNPHLDHLLEIGKLYGSIDTPWPFSDVGIEVGPAATPVDDTLLETNIHLVGMPEFDFNFESITSEDLFA